MTNYKYYPQTLVFLQFTIIGLMVLFSKGFFSSALSISIFTIGLLLGIWALRHNQLGNFNIQPKIKKDSNLITTGIYGYIRHPMYSSVIIIMFAFLVSSPIFIEIILFIFLIVVLLLKATREESLWLLHDEAYGEYKRRTRFFVPFVL